MNSPDIYNPNYSEKEVWDILTEYLNIKHNAQSNTIQRSVYADLNRAGSIFLTEGGEDEFAQLICYRNMYFNLSGNIIYQLDSDRCEEFSLKDICKYLGRPYPKAMHEAIELTEEEQVTKEENIKLIKQANSAQLARDTLKKKTKYAAICLIYAFEYQRATNLKDKNYHIHQITRDVDASRFVRINSISHIKDGAVLLPKKPTLDELLTFAESQSELEAFYDVPFKDVIQSLSTEVYAQYEHFFSKDARQLGALLFPLKNLQGKTVSALNIIDIKKSNSDKEFLFIKNEANTVGSIQINFSSIVDCEAVFITIGIESADALAEISGDVPVFATLSPKNMVAVIDSIHTAKPECLIIAALNDEYMNFLHHKNPALFKKSGTVKVCEYMARNSKSFPNIGIITPCTTLDEYNGIVTFHDLLQEFGPEDSATILHSELNKAIERREADLNEANHMLEQHAFFSKEIFNSHKLKLPELITAEDLTEEEVSMVAQSHTLIQPGEDPVLYIENRDEFIKWIEQISKSSETIDKDSIESLTARSTLMAAEASAEEKEMLQELLKSFRNSHRTNIIDDSDFPF